MKNKIQQKFILLKNNKALMTKLLVAVIALVCMLSIFFIYANREIRYTKTNIIKEDTIKISDDYWEFSYIDFTATNSGKLKSIGLYLQSSNDTTVALTLRDENGNILTASEQVVSTQGKYEYEFMYGVGVMAGEEYQIELRQVSADAHDVYIGIYSDGSGILYGDGGEYNIDISLGYSKITYRSILFLLSMLIISILCIVFVNSDQKRSFLVIAIVFGIMATFLIPAFMVQDEDAHFLRAYSISQGNIQPNTLDNQYGSYIPAAILELTDVLYSKTTSVKYMFEHHDEIVDEDDVIFSTRAYPKYYSIIGYLPQSLAMTLCDLFNLNAIYYFYMGRLFNLIFYLLIIYTALYITPIYKNIFMGFAIMPIALYLGTSNSNDALLISLSLLYAAMILRLMVKDNYHDRNSKLMIIAAILIGILTASIKLHYHILLALLLLIKPKAHKKIVYILLGCSIGIIGLSIITAIIPISLNASNISWQHYKLLHILVEPGVFISSAIRTTLLTIANSAEKFGTFDYMYFDQLRSMYWVPSLGFIILILFANESDYRLGAYQRIVCILIAASTVFVFPMMFYTAGYNAIQTTFIKGIQIRYYFSVIVFFIMALQSKRIHINIMKDGDINFAYISIIINILLFTALYSQLII